MCLFLCLRVRACARVCGRVHDRVRELLYEFLKFSSEQKDKTYEYDSEFGTLYDQMVLKDSPSIAATVELKNAITISTVPSFVISIRTGGFITPDTKEVLIQFSQQNSAGGKTKAKQKLCCIELH